LKHYLLLFSLKASALKTSTHKAYLNSNNFKSLPKELIANPLLLAEIVFAGFSVPWDNFLKAFFYLHYSLNAPIANIRKLIGLEKIRQAWIQGKRQNL
jgi:hypothetical protein